VAHHTAPLCLQEHTAISSPLPRIGNPSRQQPRNTGAVAAAASSPRPAGPSRCPPDAGKIVSIDVNPGDTVRKGAFVAVLESMKMEHLVAAGVSGRVYALAHSRAPSCSRATPALPDAGRGRGRRRRWAVARDPDHIRPDLAESNTRHAFSLDENRPDAVARRRKPSSARARRTWISYAIPQLYRIRRTGFAVAAPPPQPGRPYPEHAGRRIITGIARSNAADFVRTRRAAPSWL